MSRKVFYDSLDSDIYVIHMENYLNSLDESIDLSDEKSLTELLNKASACFPPTSIYYNMENYDEIETFSDYSEEDIKYFEALSKQRAKRMAKVIQLELPPTKEEIIDDLFEMIDVYDTIYKLPPINITDYDWNLFFDTIYDVLENKGQREYFEEIMEAIIKRVLAESLVREFEAIVLNNLMFYVPFLEEYDFTKEEIEEVMNAINKRRKKAKIIEFKPELSNRED